MEQIEGRISVEAALKACRRKFQVILVAQDAHEHKLQELLELAEQRGVPVRRCARGELNQLSHGVTHGGVIAICSPRPLTTHEQLLEELKHVSAPLLLLLEGIDDARNLGFTLRSAEAMGAHAVLVKKHVWDLDAVEISRPSAGAYERLAVVQLDDIDLLKQLQRTGVKLVGCVAGAKTKLEDWDLTQPTLLAIGGEKRGLSGAVREICNRFVTIPTMEGASLSLSHASAITLAEAARQRRAASHDQSGG